VRGKPCHNPPDHPSRVVAELALPDDDHRPAVLSQLRGPESVTCLVSRKLRLPEVRVERL